MIEQVSQASGSGSGSGSGSDRWASAVARVDAPGYRVTAPSLGYLEFTWFFTWKPVVLGQCRNSPTLLYVNAIQIVGVLLREAGQWDMM